MVRCIYYNEVTAPLKSTDIGLASSPTLPGIKRAVVGVVIRCLTSHTKNNFLDTGKVLTYSLCIQSCMLPPQYVGCNIWNKWS